MSQVGDMIFNLRLEWEGRKGGVGKVVLAVDDGGGGLGGGEGRGEYWSGASVGGLKVVVG